MVSHWPTVSPRSENHELFHNRGWLVGTEHGQGQHFHYTDRDEPGSPKVGMRYYDATNAEARATMWQRCQDNYCSQGVQYFWLDASEPAFYPAEPEHLRFHAGNGLAVSNIYPLVNARFTTARGPPVSKTY